MRLEWNKALAILAVVLILLMGYFGGWWDDFFIKSTPSQNLKPAVPSIDMTRTRLTGWKDDKKDWEIEAERIWQSSDGNFIYFQKISRGVAFSVKGKRVDFKAGWARWEKAPRLLYFGGGLEVRIDNSLVVTADGMLNYATEELICNHEVEMTRKDSRAYAKTMKINLPKDEILLEGGVLLIEKKDRVKADGVIFNDKDESYQLLGPKGVTIYP
ncbi:MAG: LPS export ABC transporter periplasmic protein LptC [Bacillota bacterium]